MADERAWETVLEHIEARLISGELRPGDRLPGERTLASELGVGRSSVREAIRALEVLGLIRTQSGSGPSAGAVIVASPEGGMRALMRLQVAAQGFPVRDIVKTRLVLETSVAGELAHAFHGDVVPDLDAARRLLDAMDTETLTPEDFLTLDAAFHLALAEASGNQVVMATMAGLRTAIESYVIDGASRLDEWGEAAARLRAEHRQILTAITEGDTRNAPDLMHEHIAGYYASISL